MNNPETSTARRAGVGVPRLVSRLVEMLDYALSDKESEELILEVTIHGLAWEEDERSDLTEDENPDGMFNERYLGDGVPLVSEEFSTTDERCPFGKDTISREDLQELRRLLTANSVINQ